MNNINMKKIVLLISVIHSFSFVNAQNWQSLFDGKTLTGWDIRDANSPVEVKNGTIIAFHKDTASHTYLCTKEEFSDFIFEVDVKVEGDLNSGILIRGISIPDFKEGKVHGYQMEIDQSERQWTGGIFEELGRGWLYDLKEKTEEKKAYKPSAWNHYRIEAIGNVFKIWVNDVPILHMMDSKTAKGVIGFQIHEASKFKGGNVAIKNIRILSKKLNKFSKEIPLEAKAINYKIE